MHSLSGGGAAGAALIKLCDEMGEHNVLGFLRSCREALYIMDGDNAELLQSIITKM